MAADEQASTRVALAVHQIDHALQGLMIGATPSWLGRMERKGWVRRIITEPDAWWELA